MSYVKLSLTLLIRCREVAGPYHEHIRKICPGWHHLRYLADFMTVSTVPLRFKSLTLGEREERLRRVNVTVVEYGNEISSSHLTSLEELDQYLSESNETTEIPTGRLLVVQDLSAGMIEKLGGVFDIEPGFFRSHIGDHVWLNTRDPQAEIPDLEALSRKSNYFNVQYVQPRYFATQESLNEARKQTESFNVLRRIDHDERFKSWSDVPGSDVGLVRSKVSLWVRPQKAENKGWLGKDTGSNLDYLELISFRSPSCRPNNNAWIPPLGWLWKLPSPTEHRYVRR
jgi:hypothetical protein